MLTNQGYTERVHLQHEYGEWVEVRPLSWRQLEQARETRISASLRRMTEIDIEGLRSLIAGQDRSHLAQSLAPSDSYDLSTLLIGGIVAWSYEAPVTPENVEALDQQTVDVVLAAILPKPASEADQKKGSDRSTAPSSEKGRRQSSGS